jgi:nicotinamide mononucleotide transporter
MNWTFAVTVLSIIGVIANTLKKRWCFIVWFFTNTIWCIYDYYIGAYAQSILFLVYIGLAVFGWFNWGKQEVAKCKQSNT